MNVPEKNCELPPESGLQTGRLYFICIGLAVAFSLFVYLKLRSYLDTKPAEIKVASVVINHEIDLDKKEKEEDSKEKIAFISVSGEISENTGDFLVTKLRAARDDKEIKAVILEVQSPGGSVHASALIHREVLKLRKSGKPIVAFFKGLAASGGYYIVTPANKIIATPETVTGSIGAIMMLPNYSGLMQKLGLEMTVIKSGKNKDMLSPYRPLTDSEKELAQDFIDKLFNQFVKVVSEGRKMSEQKVRQLADGRVYLAEDAVKNGLIDEVGYLEDAFKAAKKLANLKSAKLVSYDIEKTFFSEIREKAEAVMKLTNNLFNFKYTPQFMYLYI